MGRGNMSKTIRASKRNEKKMGGRGHFGRQNGMRDSSPTHIMNYKGICYTLILNEERIPFVIHKSIYNTSGLGAGGIIKEPVNQVSDIELRNEIIREYFKKTMK